MPWLISDLNTADHGIQKFCRGKTLALGKRTGRLDHSLVHLMQRSAYFCITVFGGHDAHGPAICGMYNTISVAITAQSVDQSRNRCIRDAQFFSEVTLAENLAFAMGCQQESERRHVGFVHSHRTASLRSHAPLCL